MHPARTLDEGQVRAVAGFSANVAVGEFASALGDARAERTASSGLSTGTDEAYAKGVLVAAAIAPGLALLIGARVWLGDPKRVASDEGRGFEAPRLVAGSV